MSARRDRAMVIASPSRSRKDLAMRRLTPIPLVLAALAVPGAAAAAAPATVAPSATSVGAAGTTTIRITNATRTALPGRVEVRAGGRLAAAAAVRLPRRSVTPVTLKLRAPALAALQRAGAQRAVVTARLRNGRRTTVARRTLTLRAAAGEPAVPAPAPAMPAAPAAPAPPAAPAAPAAPAKPANGWVGRMGSEGAHDDLELTLDGNQLTFTKPPAVLVTCFDAAGTMDWTSGELFDAPGPWTVGTTARSRAPRSGSTRSSAAARRP
jgi:hypothetical protein